jgi:hypothetical protein
MPSLLFFALAALQAVATYAGTYWLRGPRADNLPGGAIFGATCIFVMSKTEEWMPGLPLLMVTAVVAHMLAVKARRTLANRHIAK